MTDIIIETVKEIMDENNALIGYIVNGNMSVPIDHGNAHYREVKEWIAAGNTPEPAFTFDEMKARKLVDLSAKTRSYIEGFYPEIKQRSDTADKEYDGTALLMINSNYTLDQIYRDAGLYANEIIAGTSTVDEIIATLPAEEQAHWEQILKVATRVAWVKACKAVHAEYAAILEAATDQAALDAVDLENIPYPRYPL